MYNVIMSAKDLYHDTVKHALIKEGWTITHDPFPLSIGKRDAYVDLGAEKIFAAEKENQKIAIEVKSFISPSLLHDLYGALGQYLIYREALHDFEPDRVLYLAIRDAVFQELTEEELSDLLIERQHVNLLVFDQQDEEIVKWIT